MRFKDDYPTITFYLNSGIQIPFQCNDNDHNPIKVLGYSFAFIVCPVNHDGTLGTPVLSNSNPFCVEPGLITFQFLSTDIDNLLLNTPYRWTMMFQRPNDTNSSVGKSGKVTVSASPPPPSSFTPINI